LFGPGRIGKIAGELGKSIKSFREGLGSKEMKMRISLKAKKRIN
jgi:Sec-independent protein translocase protein TatA